MLLRVEDIVVAYGPVQALKGVSLHVGIGEVVALLGANGAGKSTMLGAVAGIVPFSSGIITFLGKPLHHAKPFQIVRQGVALAPEGRRVFPDLTVLENLDVAAYTVKDPQAVRRNLDRVFHYFPILTERRTQKAATLSGGQQQMLAVGRALMSSPRLLMLDEPSLGLAPMLVDQIFEIIRQINREEGVSILLVEQNAHEALLHADRAYVLENGRLTLEGPARDLMKNPKVIEAYLGV
jgi:branched-chain amino acid transport system ATP-binding protein